MVKVKIAHNKETRRYDLPAGKVFQTLLELVRKELKLESFQLRYQDDEGDYITITNESDTQEAISLAETVGQVLKVHVVTGHAVKQFPVAPRPDESWVTFPDAKEEEPEAPKKPAPAPAPSAPPTSAPGSTRFEWMTMCEDFLASKDVQDAQSKLIEVVFTGLSQGRKLSVVVMNGLKESPFRDHPFIKEGRENMLKLLEKANAFGFVLLKAGRPGVEMALPSVLRGFAKFMQTGQSAPVLVDLAEVFKQLFPEMFQMLQAMVPKGQTVDLDIGRLLMNMKSAGGLGFFAPTGEPSMSSERPAAPAPGPAACHEEEAAAKEGIVLHKGITCDVCNIGPIIGVRYKCLACPDYDMCEECAKKKEHNPDHPLVTFAKPMPRGGLRCGRDRLPGAAEMFMPPWLKHKRRAKKKWFKAMKKHAKEVEGEEAAEGGEVGATPGFDRCNWGRRRGRGGRWRGGHGGGNPWRKWFCDTMGEMVGVHGGGGGGPAPWAGSGRCGFKDDNIMDLDTPTSGSSSSSESSSSDSEMEEGASPDQVKSSKKKVLKASKKKMKKRHKKLVIRAKRNSKKVESLKKQRAKIERKLQKATKKQNKSLQELRQQKFELDKAEEAERKVKEEKKQKKKAGFKMFQESVRASKSPRADPMEEPEEMKIDPDTKPDKYVKELNLLKEMGFTDTAMNRNLLKENGGDVKNVVVLLATAAGSKI